MTQGGEMDVPGQSSPLLFALCRSGEMESVTGGFQPAKPWDPFGPLLLFRAVILAPLNG